MKVIVFLLLLVLSIFVRPDDEFQFVHESNKRMNEGFVKAQKSPGEFLDVAEIRPNEYSAFGAYVNIVDKGETE